MNIPTHIIIHTAASGSMTPSDGNGPRDWDVPAEEIRRWHMSPPNNWADIGYHFVIRKNGKLQYGRELDRSGAHAGPDWNSRSVGVCLTGHGDISPWTESQAHTFYALARFLMGLYGIPVENVIGHRETGANKTCPGKLIDMGLVRNTLRG